LVSSPPLGNNIILDIKRNNVSILEGRILTITQSNNIGNILLFDNINVLSTDYITVEIKQIGSSMPGSDLSVRLKYNLY